MSVTKRDAVGTDVAGLYPGMPELAYQVLLSGDLHAAVHISAGAMTAYDIYPRTDELRRPSAFAGAAQEVAVKDGLPFVNVVVAEPGTAKAMAEAMKPYGSLLLHKGWFKKVNDRAVNVVTSFDTSAQDGRGSKLGALEGLVPNKMRGKVSAQLAEGFGFEIVLASALQNVVTLGVNYGLEEYEETYRPDPRDRQPDAEVILRATRIGVAVRDSFFSTDVPQLAEKVEAPISKAVGPPAPVLGANTYPYR